MDILSQQEIRDAFVNCSRSEAEELPMPPGLHEVDWSRREYLGWNDPRLPQRGFVVVPGGHRAPSLRRVDAIARADDVRLVSGRPPHP
jgi:hypothetical protein